MTAPPPQLSGLPAETVAAVTRWNPVAVGQLEAGRGPGSTVFVAGPPRAGKSTLVDGLRALDSSALEFVGEPADAALVLMVFDAAAPLGREELSVLDAVASPACPVVFALTKTDVHHDWSGVSKRNRMLLARHSARFADVKIHPVTTVTGSGVEALLAAIRSAARGGARDGLSVTETVLEQTRRMIVSTARSIGETEPGAQLRTERLEALTHREGLRAERASQLRGQVQLARIELMHEVASQVRTTGATVRAEIDRARPQSLACYPDRMAQLIRDKSVAVDAAVTARLDDLCTHMGVTPHTMESEVPPADSLLPERPDRRHRGLEDRMTILIGASLGLGLGRLAVSPLSMVPALDIATVPLTLALGAVAAWGLTRSRGHAAERVHVQRWATDVLAQVRSEWEQFVLGRLLATEAQVGEAVVAESRVRIRQVDERIVQIDSELRALAAKRSAQLSSCERDLAAVERGLRHVHRLTVEPNLVAERLNT
ncbi:hypothetical protein [Rhodococcus sp. NPDC049939]|uniref:hypothetical protein n=1 Tax=Rhodococcus sp. NPDC049939 TaxID=3155511 RepID=UPI0033EA78E2